MSQQKPALLVHLPALLSDQFGISRSEARRVLVQGGVTLDGERLSSDDVDLHPKQLRRKELRLGNRRAVKLGRRIEQNEDPDTSGRTLTE